MEFTDNSRMQLFPVLIQPFGEDNFRVLRWGGRSKILTRQFGVDAIHLLQEGRTIGEVKRALGEKYGTQPSRVDLTPLLQALLRGQLIRRIDGRSASGKGHLTVSSVSWFIWRFYLSPYLRKLSVTVLPLQAYRRLCFWVRFFDLRKAMKPALEEAGRNMAAIWPGKSPAEISKFQAEFYRHWIWNLVDVEMFETRKATVLDRWMSRHMSIQGIEHLNRARESKQGVILCVFHFSSTRPLPILLMKYGYPVTAIAPANMGWGMNKTIDVLEKFKTPELGYAPFHLAGDFSLPNLKRLLNGLQQGEVATCMADVIPGLPKDRDAVTQERMRYFRLASQEFPRASVAINFLEHRIDMTAWVGWLAAVSGAVILPTMMLRKSDHQLELRIGSPVTQRQASVESKTDIKQTVNSALYRTLERYVTEYPAQWFAWHNLRHVGLQRAAAPSSAQVQETNRAAKVAS